MRPPYHKRGPYMTKEACEWQKRPISHKSGTHVTLGVSSVLSHHIHGSLSLVVLVLVVVVVVLWLLLVVVVVDVVVPTGYKGLSMTKEACVWQKRPVCDKRGLFVCSWVALQDFPEVYAGMHSSFYVYFRAHDGRKISSCRCVKDIYLYMYIVNLER